MAAVALSATSCLDKMPEDSIPFDDAIQTVDDVNLAVIGIYDAFKNSALYSGNLTILPDLQTDLVYGINGNTNTYGDIWRWKRHSGNKYKYRGCLCRTLRCDQSL